MIQWLVNVQKQLDKDTVVELGYIGNGGHKLELLRVWNQPVNRLGANDSRTLLQRSPFPAYGIIQMVDNHANSDYEGLSLKATRRFSKGLTYLSGFTWSKAMDQGSAIRNNTGDNQFATDNYNFHREHSLSQFHNGRRFVTSVLYDLPFGEGKRMASGRVASKILRGLGGGHNSYLLRWHSDQRRPARRYFGHRHSERSRCDGHQPDTVRPLAGSVLERGGFQ